MQLNLMNPRRLRGSSARLTYISTYRVCNKIMSIEIDERYRRIEDSIIRVSNEVKQLYSDQIARFQGLKRGLDSLATAKASAEAQISEQESRIVSMKSEKTKLQKQIEDLSRGQGKKVEELKAKEHTLKALQDTLKSLQGQISSHTNEVDARSRELETRKARVDELRRSNIDLDSKLKSELGERDTEIKKLANEVLQQKNQFGAATFLIEDSAESLPEIEILAILKASGTRLTKDKLKGNVSPVILTRALGKMV